MNDRLTTLAGAVLAFAIFFVLFVGDSLESDRPVSTPVTTDDGVAGYLALYRWLDESGISVYSLRQRYDRIASIDELSSTGNLMITTLPHRYPVRLREDDALEDWLMAGNHLLILQAQPLAPPWAVGLQGNSQALIEQYSASWLEQILPEEDDLGQTVKGLLQHDRPPFILLPKGRHPLLAGIESLEIPASTGGVRYVTASSSNAAVLELLRYDDLAYGQEGDLAYGQGGEVGDELGDEGDGIFSVSVYGEGRVMLMTSSAAFANNNLARADNARFIVNIINHYVASDGHVIFDDMHHGLSVLYDPDAFFKDDRLHVTLIFMFFFWLIYVLAYSNRFVRVRPLQRARIYSLDYIEALSRFLARCLHRQDTVAQMLKNFFNDVRRHFNMPLNGEPAWEPLRRLSQVRDDDLNRLEAYCQRADSGKRINLVNLHNLTIKIRKDMS